MKRVRIAIVGAGLRGRHAAWRLERMGIRDYVVLEARDLPGGPDRILQCGRGRALRSWTNVVLARLSNATG